jgi:hypothetical protein
VQALRTGTHDPMPEPVAGYPHHWDTEEIANSPVPAVFRQRSGAPRTAAVEELMADQRLDIPAFLRKQAD